MYGLDVSLGTLNAITDQLLAELKEWHDRPLESHYPIVWMDALHYKVKEDGRYGSKAIYTLLSLNLDGEKEILGLYLSENEGANDGLTVLTELQNRGVEDILIACIDGLTGFS
ncbi:ISSod5, transposase [hydrothermal vent metagenome]|uniref:ISSod5, transposase n=1 Tax=hydrothermal vent metagenome TaxID=652676 RepID=A0A3B0ZG25_9ZZZZ